MFRRRSLIFMALGMSVVAVVGFIVNDLRDPHAPNPNWPFLQNAKTSTTSVECVVGPNQRVTDDDIVSTFLVGENVAASDPTDPHFQYTAVMGRKFDPTSPGDDIFLFVSHDEGKTWKMQKHFVADEGHHLADPTLAVDLKGTVLLCFVDVANDQKTGTGQMKGSLVFAASTDHGQTWTEQSRFPRFIDRPWLGVAHSKSNLQGTFYCLGNDERWNHQQEMENARPIFLASADGFASFSPEVNPHGDGRMVNCRPSKPLALSDGEIIVAFCDRYLSRRTRSVPRPMIYVAASTDGGKSFEMRSTVDRQWWHDQLTSGADGPNGAAFPMIASDTNTDKIYCVWEDGSGIDGCRIFLSSSNDRGQSWSRAVVISEQSLSNPDKAYLSFMPQISVNSRGVVAVTWYDRRGLSPSSQTPIPGAPGVVRTVSPGWNLRARISMDAGQSWHPSFQLNEKPGTGMPYLGHTMGLAATPSGAFLATWVDNRNGSNDLWSATFNVSSIGK